MTMVMTDPASTQRNKIKTFLREFAQRLEEAAKNTLNGTIQWEDKQLTEALYCVQLRYTENGKGDDFPVFNMFIDKRYHTSNNACDIVRIENTEEEHVTYMQADPKSVLAVISF